MPPEVGVGPGPLTVAAATEAVRLPAGAGGPRAILVAATPPLLAVLDEAKVVAGGVRPRAGAAAGASAGVQGKGSPVA